MAFDFLCPQGHVLRGEESQVGQRCQCPYCRREFVVPQPLPEARPYRFPVGEVPPDHQPPADESPPDASAAGAAQDVLPQIRTGSRGGHDPAEAAAQIGSGDVRQQSLLHIPCPNGHVLETPREMLGQEAMCPHCEATFWLRPEDSEQYRREKAARQQRRERKLGKAWLHWSIATAAVVLLGLVLLIVMAAYR